MPNGSIIRWWLSGFQAFPRLTLFGRSFFLITLELVANAVCWTACAILFGRNSSTRSILSLALLAWTIGLRHALDADHISAIDNATRTLLNMGQLPVTCGLFFSLGHSTIVIVVNVAIAISTDVYDKIDGIGRVGGIVGSAVSASFLFIVGVANSIILWRIISKRRRKKRSNTHAENTEDIPEDDDEHDADYHSQGNTLMMKLLGPVVTFVDRPWKMYPVGVLFGFGFDTASSIALLAVSAIAKKGPKGEHISPGDIVILPLLFTVGMTLIDSVDSILMLYSYAGFPERSFAIFEFRPTTEVGHPPIVDPVAKAETVDPFSVAKPPSKGVSISGEESKKEAVEIVMAETVEHESFRRKLQVKRNTMSNLSVILTVMSILVAFSISLITTMGLIGNNCRSCQTAADAQDGGGLAGRWWRFWSKANDNSGYIGAAIVGSFVAVVCIWYGAQFIWCKLSRQPVDSQPDRS